MPKSPTRCAATRTSYATAAWARHRYPNSPVVVFARSDAERVFARELGAAWAGDTSDVPPGTCHAIIDTSDTSPTRKKHVEVPTRGTMQDVYKAKYNLTGNLQAWDSGSAYGNPLVGVCFTCHSGYDQHVSRTVGVIAGCQDCHDEHAEGVGAGGNKFMIPQTAKKAGLYASVTTTRAKAGTEAVTYDTTLLNTSTGAFNATQDFYTSAPAGAGVCGRRLC